jgi:hypothetical protein
MSNKLATDNYSPEIINALIVSHGKTRLVKVPWPLLILSEPHWVAYTITAMRLMSQNSTDPGDILIAVDCEQAATDLEKWLATGSDEIINTYPDVALRDRFSMPVVSLANAHEYADALITCSLPMAAGMEEISSIVCVLNADTLKLSVLSDYCFLATHSGDIQGEIVSAPQMATLTLDAFEGLVDDFLDGDE